MRSGLGHCVVCYMFMDVLEVHLGPVFTGCQKMEALCPE